MEGLIQFAWVSSTNIYQFGHRSIPRIAITGAPADADLGRWAMLHDHGAYRLLCFRSGSRDTLYQFSFDGVGYAFGHHAAPVLSLAEVPADADAGSFAVLNEGGAYHLYLRRSGDPRTLYRAAWAEGTTQYRFGREPPVLSVTGFPEDTDWSRWTMLHDGAYSRFYAFRRGGSAELFQGAFNPGSGAFEYAFRSIPVLTIAGAPADCDTRSVAMLHDELDYRLYFRALPAAARPEAAPTARLLASALNVDGRLEVFRVGGEGGVHNHWQTRPSSGPWGGGSFGGRVKQITAARNVDGRLEVFAIGEDDELYHLWQTRPAAGPWSGWNHLGPGGRLTRLAAALNSDGRLEVIGIGVDEGLHSIWQTAPAAGPWSGWADIGAGGRLKDLSVAPTADGRLEVFAIGTDDALWHIEQTRPAAGPWSAWSRLGGAVKQIAAARNADGRLEVLAVGSDDALYTICQTAPGAGPWSAWVRLGGVVKEVASALNLDGRLEVFAIGSDDALYSIAQTRPASGPWSGWSRLGGVVRRIDAARNADGRLEVFAVGTDDALWNLWQTAPGAGPWSGWNRLG